MNYQEIVGMIARKWEWKFNHAMTRKDFKLFSEEVKQAEVNMFDVYSEMEDYDLI